MNNATALSIQVTILQHEKAIESPTMLGLRSPIIQKTCEPTSATSLIARVHYAGSTGWNARLPMLYVVFVSFFVFDRFFPLSRTTKYEQTDVVFKLYTASFKSFEVIAVNI